MTQSSASEPARQAEFELWTVADVSTYLHMSKSWVYKNYGRYFTAYRAGRVLRFDAAEVRAVIQRSGKHPR